MLPFITIRVASAAKTIFFVTQKRRFRKQAPTISRIKMCSLTNDFTQNRKIFSGKKNEKL